MPEVQEVFRMATQKVRPEPGALERQFQGQRRRLARRKAGAFGLAAALMIVAVALAVQASSDPGGGGRVPAEEGTGEALLGVRGYGFGFSADGTRLFAQLGPSGAIYEAETGALLQEVSGRGDGVVAFSPDGQRFVTVRGGDATEVRTFVYDTATGDELWRFRRACCYAAFSPDGRLLAIPQNVPHTSVIDLDTGERVKQVDSWGATAFSPDGRRLLITPDPGTAEKGVVGYVYDVFADERDPVLVLHGIGKGNIPSVYAAWNPWSRDGSMIAIPTSTGKVFVWDAETGEELFEIDAAGDFWFTGFGPGSLLAAGSTNGRAIVFDLSSGSAERLLTIEAYNRFVDHVVFDPEGTRLMTAAWNRPTKVWDVST